MHDLPKKTVMNEAKWTECAQAAGFDFLSVVANILRWENYRSLFALIQIGDANAKILAFDSGQGLCRGLYSSGTFEKDPTLCPTWETLFKLYQIETSFPSGINVIREKEGENWDAEMRMCAYFKSKKYEGLKGQNITLLTAASPCNATCAKALATFAAESGAKSITLKYLLPYVTEELTGFIASLDTMEAAKITCQPLSSTFIDGAVWIGMKDQAAEDIISFLKTSKKVEKATIDRLEQQIKEWRSEKVYTTSL